MAKIKIFDYTETIQDDWWGSYEEYFYIGQGNLSASVLVPQIEAVADGEDIEVDINSVGGLVFDGWAIYNALVARKATGNKIIVKVCGIAASIASIISMAGDEVIICKAAMIMIHKPTANCFYYDGVDSTTLKREAAALDEIQAVLNSIYVKRTGLDTVAVDMMIDAETWLSPDKAITLGFADRLDEAVEAVDLQMSENAFTNLFKNADPSTRAYANKSIKINKMSKPTALSQSQELIKKNTEASNGLLDFFKNLKIPGFKNTAEEPVNASSELKDGGEIHYEGVLGVGTEVFTDAEMTTHPAEGSHDLADGNYIVVDAEGLVTEMDKKAEEATDDAPTNADLAARVTALEAENSQLTNALSKSNEALEANNALLTSLKNVKSKFSPESREQEVDKKPRNAAEPVKTYDRKEVEKKKAELKANNTKTK